MSAVLPPPGGAAADAIDRWANLSVAPPTPCEAARQLEASAERADRLRAVRRAPADSRAAASAAVLHVRQAVAPRLASDALSVARRLTEVDERLDAANHNLRTRQHSIDVARRRKQLLIQLQSHLVQFHRPVGLALQLTRPDVLDGKMLSDSQLRAASAAIESALSILQTDNMSYLRHLETVLSQRRASLVAQRKGAMRRKLHCDPARGILVIEPLQDDTTLDQLKSLVAYITTDQATQALPVALRRASWVRSTKDPASTSGLFIWGFQSKPADGLPVQFESAIPEERLYERVVLLYNLLLDTWHHPNVSDLLAQAFDRWLVEDIVDPTWILGLPEPPVSFLATPADVSWADLPHRIKDISAASVIAENGIGARADSHWLVLEDDRLSPSSLEKRVATACRAEILLHTSSALAEFPMDDQQHVLVAPGGSPHRPKEGRDPLWFPSCLVTRSACQIATLVKDIFLPAASSLHQSSTEVLPTLLVAAIREGLQSYRVHIPLQFEREIQSSLRLQALFHNDCLLLAHLCSTLPSTILAGSLTLFRPVVDLSQTFQSSADECRGQVVKSCDAKIVGALAPLDQGDGLAQASSLFGRRRVHQSLARALKPLQETVTVIAGFLPVAEAQQLTYTLAASYLDKQSLLIIRLDSISVSSCEAIAALTKDTLGSAEAVVSLARKNVLSNDDRSRLQYTKAARRLDSVRQILDSRMDNIIQRFISGEYSAVLESSEIQRLIVAIFEDTPLRKQYLSQLQLRPASQPEGTGDGWDDWHESSSDNAPPSAHEDAEQWSEW